MVSESDGDGNRKNTVRLTERKDGSPIQVQSSVLSQSEEVKGDSVLGLNCDSVASPSKSGVKSSYSSVVEGAPATAEEPEFVVKDGIVEIAIPAELLEDVEPLWKCFVVGYFMNDVRHIRSIHATINRIWSLQGKCNQIDVQFIGKTTVLFQTEDVGVQSRVLKRKFWHITEVPLMVGEWTPETARAPPDLSAMPLWVDLTNVPGYLYSKKGLSFLARTVGKFIKLHPKTALYSYGCCKDNG